MPCITYYACILTLNSQIFIPHQSKITTIYIFCVSLGSADGADYDTGAFPLSVVFQAGDAEGIFRCATPTVLITQDSEPEGTQSFTISEVFSTAYTFGIPSFVTVFISDDDDGKTSL